MLGFQEEQYKMKMKTFALIATMIFCVAGTLFAGGLTSGKGKLSGVVTDKETGQPLEGVVVKLFMPEVNQWHKPFPKTNKDGKWRIHYIRKGTWNIDFEKSGFETVKLSAFVDPTPGTKNPPVEVSLKKLEGPVVTETVLNEINTAKNLMAEKKFGDALKMLLKIQSENKDDPGIDIVYLYIGNCYGAQGDYNKAISFYEKSLEKFPKNKNLLVSIGNAYNNLKNFDKAMEWFLKLNIDEIGNKDTLYNIGVIAYNKGDFAGSAKYFEKATTVAPDFADAFYQLGMTLTALNKPKEAVTALKKFMEMAPDSPNFETAKAVVDAFK
jgi:Flp pilus assembly protein TadD